MRVLVCTELFVTDGEELVETLNGYDASFGERYALTKGDYLDLSGECFYDADKYNIFYLTIQSEKWDALIEYCKARKGMNAVAHVDAQYQMQGEPYFVTDRWEKIPSYLRSLGPQFEPKSPEPTGPG